MRILLIKSTQIHLQLPYWTSRKICLFAVTRPIIQISPPKFFFLNFNFLFSMPVYIPTVESLGRAITNQQFFFGMPCV